MKDRWKLLITSLVVTAIIIILIAFLMSSFKQVSLREYGILHYSVYNTVENQTARSNGNYLVGLDHSFYTFPRGILTIDFDTFILTKDKSMVEVQGFFAGRLVKSQIMNLYTNYGFQYLDFVKASVQQLTRQAIQTYSLSDLIQKRAAVDSNVDGYVCLKLQATYSWIKCDVVSLGSIGRNIPAPQLLKIETTFEQKHIQLLNTKIQTQRVSNIYKYGGIQMLKSMEQIHSNLFRNVTNAIADSLQGVSDPVQWSRYIIDSARHPTLKNQFQIDL